MKFQLYSPNGTGFGIENSTDVLQFSNELNEIDSSIVPFLLDWFDENSHIIVSTSGSTGTPKMIELSKEAMIMSAQQTNAFFQLKPHQSALLCLPTQFIAGKMMLIRALVGQLNLFCVPPTGNPLLDINQNIDFAAFTPFQVSQVLNVNPLKINFIQTLIIGGGVIDQLLENKLNENWVKTNCYSTFGMTETITHIALKKVNGVDKELFFRTLPNVTVSASKNDTLVISAPYIQKEPIVTNDSIELLDENRFIWKGRVDFVINSGGVKLFPEQMEVKIAPLMGNVNYYFSKEHHNTLGEVPVLYIEALKFKLPDLSSILSKYEIPHKIYFEENFSRTETGKIIRR